MLSRSHWTTLLALALAACSSAGTDGGVADIAGRDGSGVLDIRGGDGADATVADGPPAELGPTDGPAAKLVTVRPTEIQDTLHNPGMGVANFHGNAPAKAHPPTTVAYFRWDWAELEPSEGAYNFAMVDGVIQAAVARGETLSFRVMTHHGGSTPQWLLKKGVASVKTPDGYLFPDHNDASFLSHHDKLLAAFGQRYAGKAEIDHLDIGSVGCWGEWNTACCGAVEATCKQYFPSDANQKKIIDAYFKHFPKTPLVMLVGGPVAYAVGKGAGWRGDCFGDYGWFSSAWNHMDNVYGPTAKGPVTGVAWKTAPVQFEVCGVMQDWFDKGFDIDKILQKGVEWHMSVLNAKSSPVPTQWSAKVDAFLKKIGYRFVLEALTHPETVAPGAPLSLSSKWQNKGTAPIYKRWPLAYRLRSSADAVVAQWQSKADLKSWLPGPHQVSDQLQVPAGVPPGNHSLDIAILTEDGKKAHVQLAIGGKRADTWYPVSSVTVTAP